MRLRFCFFFFITILFRMNIKVRGRLAVTLAARPSAGFRSRYPSNKNKANSNYWLSQTTKPPALGLAAVTDRRPREKPLNTQKSKTVANEWLARKHSYIYQLVERQSRNTIAKTGKPTGSFLPSGVWRNVINVLLFLFFKLCNRMSINVMGRLAVTVASRLCAANAALYPNSRKLSAA